MSVHRILQDSLKKIPTAALEKLLGRKLRESGVRTYRVVAKELARHIQSGAETPFEWGNGDAGKMIDISFGESDVHELQKISGEMVDAIPDIISRLSRKLASDIASRYENEWKAVRYREEREMRRFRDNLEDRWGEGLDALRVLIEICRQTGERGAKKLDSSRARKGKIKNSVILRLHIRSCQIASEILTLLENGFADGALARWRTLHELSIVALIISDGDDELATRYSDHDAVEAKKALDRFKKDRLSLGYKELSQREIARIEAGYKRVVDKYGSSFKTEHGWAAKLLSIDRPRFIDLQDAAGRGSMHSHYKMASYNVHAGARALTSRVGNLYNDGTLIAGASNAGLDEAGVRMAESLSLITYAVPGVKYKIDNAIEVLALSELRDRAVKALISADRTLRSEDAEIRRTMAELEVAGHELI